MSNFKPLKEIAGTKKNKRHPCNMNAFVFVLPCKACLLPFTEQRALSWVWSPHSPQTRHFISFLQYKRCLFLLKKYFLQDIQDKDRERDRPLYIIFTRQKIPFLLQSKGRHDLSKNICLTRPSILCVTHQMSRKTEVIYLAQLCVTRRYIIKW